MGIYAEYLNLNLNGNQFNQERKKFLKKISDIRGRDVLVFASALSKFKAPISIDYDDIVPLTDQINNLNGDKKIEIKAIFKEPLSGKQACIRKNVIPYVEATLPCFRGSDQSKPWVGVLRELSRVNLLKDKVR